MPSARKRIIYTYDDWFESEYDYYYSDQLPELYYDHINGTHDHLISKNNKKYFVTAKRVSESIDQVWDMKASRKTSLTTPYFGVYTEQRLDVDPAVAWDNILTDAGGGFQYFGTSADASNTVGKALYLLTSGANAGKYLAHRCFLWMSFWGMEIERTPLTKNLYFGVGYDTYDYQYCTSASVSIYQQSSGVYPTSLAEAETMRQSPGTLLYSFSSLATTGESIAELDIDVDTSVPITLMFGPTNQDSMPAIDANDFSGLEKKSSININNEHNAYFVQYYGWLG